MSDLAPTNPSKFEEAHARYQSAAQRFVQVYDSSEEEEEVEEGVAEDVIGSVLVKYKSSDESNPNVSKAAAFLGDSLASGSNVCLVCISAVKRNDFTWDCSTCSCIFHLTCVQRWSKDTIAQQKHLDNRPTTRRLTDVVTWCCPKCRQSYGTHEIPTVYRCFCRKTCEPEYQPFLVPHSCGETCGKQLKPGCGHTCVLLCHPGPCPPCPQTVTVACLCGSQPPTVQRCISRRWSCGLPCGKRLACGKHKCVTLCHVDDCPPCPKKSIQRCGGCGGASKLRDCATPTWTCDKVCGKPLACGNHACTGKCHPTHADCGTCELSKSRNCPCGKSSYQLPCTAETPTCGDTCGKTLDCGMHVCQQRCHRDKCGSCAETVTKWCRCGQHAKEVQCERQFLCDTKCKKWKDCGKHACNRKCCDSDCQPCEKPCGRTLSCGNHKCTSVCHRGPCYPCVAVETIACRCKTTAVTMPCGRRRKPKPPRCTELCRLPQVCHHAVSVPHRCHYGDCPPCRQPCGKRRVGDCEHDCRATCHSAVWVSVGEGAKPPSMPWEQTKPAAALTCLDCPECDVPVLVDCLGEHGLTSWPCRLAKKVTGCGRACGRVLACENHTCELECHDVGAALDRSRAGVNCQTCHAPCARPRPTGCLHACVAGCHPGPCARCAQTVRLKCHCGLNQPYVECASSSSSPPSCGDRCPRTYPCGHRCRSTCHPGVCPDADGCRKKVKVACDCRRLKREVACDSVRAGVGKVECDSICLAKREESLRAKRVEEESRSRQEQLRDLKELEMYEKKLTGRRRATTRSRRVSTVVRCEATVWWKSVWVWLVALVVAVVAFVCLL